MPSNRFLPILDALTIAAHNVHFVQVGSNNGIHHDPLRPYIAGGEWHGILIEPVPYLFAQLIALYPNRPDLIFENVAIASAGGERKFYYVTEAGDATDEAVIGVGSFSLAHVMKHAGGVPNFGKRVRATNVPCLSLESLFDKHQINHLDAFVIDAEGYDWEILQTFPFARMHPTVLLYEHVHLKPEALKACRALLSQQGYLLLRRHANSMAVLEKSILTNALLKEAWERATEPA